MKLSCYLDTDSRTVSMINQLQSALPNFGKDAKGLTTKARRTHAVMVDYWNKKSVKDLKLRKELGLAK